MYSFGSKSKSRLDTCHADIQAVLNVAIQICDFKIIWGHRSHDDQMKAFNEGRSKVLPPNSKHNRKPSLAVDIAPWPIKWNDREQFTYVAGVIMGVAKCMGIQMRWGGDWNRDGRVADNTFDDLGHFELFGEKYDNSL